MLPKSVDTLRIDINSGQVRKSVAVCQSDSVQRTLNFLLVNNGNKFELIDVLFAEILIHKADDTEIDNGCVIDGDSIQYTLRSNDIAALGINKAQILLTFNDGETLTTPPFEIVVYSKVLDQNVQQSTNEYGAIAALLAQTNESANNAAISAQEAAGSSAIAENAAANAEEYKDAAAASAEKAEHESKKVNLQLGVESYNAFWGDKGQTAYEHSQTSGNPHGTTAEDIGATTEEYVNEIAADKANLDGGNTFINGHQEIDAKDLILQATNITSGQSIAENTWAENRLRLTDSQGNRTGYLQALQKTNGNVDVCLKADNGDLRLNGVALNNILGSIAGIENDSTASQTYNAGKYILRNGSLYKTIDTIASGAAFTDGVNIASTNIGDELTQINRNLSNKLLKVFIDEQQFSGGNNANQTVNISLPQGGTKMCACVPIFLINMSGGWYFNSRIVNFTQTNTTAQFTIYTYDGATYTYDLKYAVIYI